MATAHTARRRAATLAALIVLQALCAAFFAADVAVDALRGDRLDDLHMGLELLATLALIGGVVVLGLELRQLLHRMARMDTGLRAARGEVAALMDGFFDAWRLTPSERDVALLILKGFDNESIATLRGTAPGTVRAQTARVYAKAGVDGRAQLFGVFLEELFAEG